MYDIVPLPEEMPIVDKGHHQQSLELVSDIFECHQHLVRAIVSQETGEPKSSFEVFVPQCSAQLRSFSQ